MLVPAALFALSLFATGGQPTLSRMILKDGRTFLLKEPPRLAGSRIVFTTLEGKVYSMAEAEVVSIAVVPPPPPPPRAWNPQDSKALGAIARGERVRRGIRSDLAPASPRQIARTRKRTAGKLSRSPSRTPAPGS